MLQFVKQSMRLNSINVRREFAGKSAEGGRTASDLRLTVKGGNDLLDKLSPHLRGSFYQAGAAKLALGDLSLLIHPLLQSTLTYDYKCAGYVVAIDHGLDEEDPILLEDAQINDFKLTFQEGGTVAINMRVQFHPEDGQLDLLKEMLQQDVRISMTPPAAQPEREPQLTGIEDLEAKRETRKGRKNGVTAH